MNRLWYVWTEGHGGATGEASSGPFRQKPVLAGSAREAREMVAPRLTSWDGKIMKVTTDEKYAPSRRYVW